ncbi:hypothetical protein Chor_000048 [Crotalus horridus]
MKGPLVPVGRDRRISDFPKCYTPEACLQLREDFHAQVRAACQRRSTGSVRFCKEVFDRDYKATIGVDFEIERFEIAGVPYNLQIWDTAGQEKFKCIASAYYRGAEVIITVFDLADIQTLDHTKQWLEEALQENRPGSSFVFLVGTKKDLLKAYLGFSGKRVLESNAESERTERDAVRLANEMQAEYWSVSAKTGENVKDFFFRVAALAFERDRRKRGVFTRISSIQPELLLMADSQPELPVDTLQAAPFTLGQAGNHWISEKPRSEAEPIPTSAAPKALLSHGGSLAGKAQPSSLFPETLLVLQMRSVRFLVTCRW